MVTPMMCLYFFPSLLSLSLNFCNIPCGFSLISVPSLMIGPPRPGNLCNLRVILCLLPRAGIPKSRYYRVNLICLCGGNVLFHHELKAAITVTKLGLLRWQRRLRTSGDWKFPRQWSVQPSSSVKSPAIIHCVLFLSEWCGWNGI